MWTSGSCSQREETLYSFSRLKPIPHSWWLFRAFQGVLKTLGYLKHFHRDKNQLPIKFRAGNSWKSRNPPKKWSSDWDVHSWGHTWGSWMMAPWFCWTKGDFRLLRSRRGGIDRTGMLRRTRSKTSRTPQQTHHWCSFICRPLEHRQNIWLLTFSAELSKPALQEIRRFSFLADGLSV